MREIEPKTVGYHLSVVQSYYGPGAPQYLAHIIVKVGFGPLNILDKKGLK